MKREFEGKTAMVTGAGSGIGAEIALRLAAEGARVVVADLDEESARTIADEMDEAGGTAVPVRQDVGDPDSVRRSSSSPSSASADSISRSTMPESPAAWRRSPITVSTIGRRLDREPRLDPRLGRLGQRRGLCRRQAWRGRTDQVGGARICGAGRQGECDRPRLYRYAAPQRARAGRLRRAGRPPPGRPSGQARGSGGAGSVLLSDRASFVTGSYHLVDGGYTAQ